MELTSKQQKALDKDDERKARIAQQFRERENMAYELDCTGTRLIVRMFPSPSEREWRVEARTTDAPGAVVAKASAPTRAQALGEVAAWWRAQQHVHDLPSLDWEAVARALSAVRAL